MKGGQNIISVAMVRRYCQLVDVVDQEGEGGDAFATIEQFNWTRMLEISLLRFTSKYTICCRFSETTSILGSSHIVRMEVEGPSELITELSGAACSPRASLRTF